MELGSMWDYEETIDELKQKLVYATIELESLKVEANEETRKHKEDVEQLMIMLNIATQERDEAKGQLQKLLNNLILSKSTTEYPCSLSQSQSGNPLVISGRGKSSITESNSLSDHTHYHHSHGSSPVDSFLDAIASPDFSSINNVAESSQMGFVGNPFVQECNKRFMSAGLVAPAVARIDPADAVIDSFVKGKVLPQKGKLLQAVMETGPLLHTLLLAGPLPQWKNPPTLQPTKILPISIRGCENPSIRNQNMAPNYPSSLDQKPLASPSYMEFRRGSSKTCSSMLNFASGASGSGLDNNGCLLNSGAIHQIPAGKRQRF